MRLARETRRPGLPSRIQCIPNERKRTPRLATMLWAKAEQDDPTLAHLYFGERDPILYSIFAAQPT